MNNILSNTKIILATPRGFCAGVERAVEILDKAITAFGSPIYVKHEVVHNKFIISDFKNKGVIFIENIKEVPNNSILIYSAHGVSMEVKKIAELKNLKVFDATCPLVTKVHMEVHKFAKLGIDVVLIGHNGHPEIEGTMGQYKSDTGKIHLIENIKDVEKMNITNSNLAYVTQTTLSIDDTKKIIEALIIKYPKIKGPVKDDICYATQNRQDAVKSILNYCDYLLVVGSQNSSNSKRLAELAIKNNIPSMLIDDKNDINLKILKDKKIIGITAGASAPKVLFDDLLKYLISHGAIIKDFRQQIIKEDVVFSVPRELRNL